MAETTPTPEIPTTPIVETPITDEKKPCTSCAMDAVNKKLKTQYFISAMSVIGIIAGIWIYKKQENANRFVLGISLGIFITLLVNSVLKIYDLNVYKDVLNQPTTAAA
jgi:hypothetical protein